MEVRITGKNIIIGDKTTSFWAAVRAYLTKHNPVEVGKPINKKVYAKLKVALEKIAGRFYINLLQNISDYKTIPLSQLQKIKKNGTHLGSGKYATVYQWENYAIKILPHKFYTDLPRIDGKLEAQLLSILRDKLIFTGRCPNIVTMYQYTPDKKTDYIVLEKLSKTLWSHLHSTVPDHEIKGFILQILFSLAMIQSELPGFRHNDLKVDNVLLDTSARNKNLTLIYNGKAWLLPSAIPLVKISDFDYAHVPGLTVNPKVGTEYSESFGCTAEESKIYDVHLFLNSLYGHRKKLGKEVVKWLQQQLPVAVRGQENTGVKYGRLKDPKAYSRRLKGPFELLQSPFFAEFKTKKISYPIWGT